MVRRRSRVPRHESNLVDCRRIIGRIVDGDVFRRHRVRRFQWIERRRNVVVDYCIWHIIHLLSLLKPCRRNKGHLLITHLSRRQENTLLTII